MLKAVVALLTVYLPTLVLALALLSRSTIEGILGAFPNAYVAFLAPTLVGGVVFLILEWAIARGVQYSPRAVASVLSPVVASGWLLTGFGHLLLEPRYVAAILCATLTFAATLWLVRGSSSKIRA